MQYLFSCLIGYLLGSIPTAFIILKKAKGIDITTTGTGNVGAMNSYEISNSKSLGFLVFAIDFIKGCSSVIVVLYLVEYSFVLAGMSLVFAIFSHCFNPWLKFKGGRGLATAAGGTIIIFPFLLVSWIVLWLLTYLTKKDILLANILATLFSFVCTLIFYKQVIVYAYPHPITVNELILFTSSLLLIIFIKHIEPLKEIISNKH
jgi:acyl phosphate:glycerol-3-phosphate acyltransferase